MELDQVTKSSEFIVRRNVSERVSRVLIGFDSSVNKLRVAYYTISDPTDDDCEDCELTCGELIAEFPQIQNAETICLSFSNYIPRKDDVIVYSN